MSECRYLISILAVVAMFGSPASLRAESLAPAEVAVRIDQRITEAWTAARVHPAPHADDAAFLRRLMLDLVGRIPTAAEATSFLENESPDKRAELAQRLVSSSAHARFAATFWRQEWVPQANTPQFALLAEEIDEWLAKRFREGAGYDRIIHDLMTATSENAKALRSIGGEAGAAGFLAASEYKPENLAANTARAFLGINLDCAQCHDHPFARWTRNQFWETAAFFARPAGDATQPVRLQLEIPDTKSTVSPRFLTDPQPVWPDPLRGETGRIILANWVTSANNPWFARNAVNRVWSGLMGVGLVEPLDDLNTDNTPSHPQLLDELAQVFRASGFDLKHLTLSIVLSRAYQLGSNDPAKETANTERLFTRYNARALSGEQLYDSLRIAAGLSTIRSDLDPEESRERLRFSEKFRGGGGAQRSILQALSLMNGELTARITRPESSPTLRAIGEAPFLNAEEKIDALFLATLTRRPTRQERQQLAAILATAADKHEARSPLPDLFWALLCSSEFSTNH